MSTEPGDRDPEHCGSQACMASCGCICSECKGAVKVLAELGHSPREQSLLEIALERLLSRLCDLKQPDRDEAAFILMMGIVGTLEPKKTASAVLPILFPEFFPKKA